MKKDNVIIYGIKIPEQFVTPSILGFDWEDIQPIESVLDVPCQWLGQRQSQLTLGLFEVLLREDKANLKWRLKSTLKEMEDGVTTEGSIDPNKLRLYIAKRILQNLRYCYVIKCLLLNVSAF